MSTIASSSSAPAAAAESVTGHSAKRKRELEDEFEGVYVPEWKVKLNLYDLSHSTSTYTCCAAHVQDD
jgi:hypothetical protein